MSKPQGDVGGVMVIEVDGVVVGVELPRLDVLGDAPRHPVRARGQHVDDAGALAALLPSAFELVRGDGPGRWRIDLTIHGERGIAGLARLNLQQSTVFETHDNQYRPISQALVKRVFLSNRKTVGVYDWNARSARWTGDVKETRRRPVPLQSGDMSGLLINLAVIRDARPGARLQYRFVDGGRVREYRYQAEQAPEIVPVGEMSYSALRVSRTNGGNDEMIIWVADGVPTPVRILQREDGEDRIDLRLIEYQGV